MQSNKINQIQSLRKTNQSQHLQLEQIITILLFNKVLLEESRKFVVDSFPSIDMQWREMQDEELEKICSSAHQFIIKNREKWKKEQAEYSKLLIMFHEQEEKVRQLSNFDAVIDKTEMKDKLDKVLLKLRGFYAIEQQTEQKTTILKQITSIENFIGILNKLIQFQIISRKYQIIYEQQSTSCYKTVLQQLKRSIKEEEQMRRNIQRGPYIQKIEEYLRKIKIIMRRLEQIFLFYCRENDSSGQTFQQYTKSSQKLDLRLFLKYFKDFSFVQINKYRFKVSTVTLLFRSQAENGMSLSFKQFWNIHRELFDFSELNINKTDLPTVQIDLLFELKQKCQLEIGKIKELTDIVSEDKSKEKLNVFNIKTESSVGSPQPKLFKSSSVVDSKMQSNNSSKYYQKSAFQGKDNFSHKFNKNFIQVVREEINNQQNSPLKNMKKNERSQSLFNLNSHKKTIASVHLPKILKISDEQISNQNIYTSLKHFAKYDYLAQQKKIRDKIGISREDDQQYMKAYFHRQNTVKQQKNKQKIEERESIKRKKLQESLMLKQQVCKKCKHEDIQPYMRFS